MLTYIQTHIYLCTYLHIHVHARVLAFVCVANYTLNLAHRLLEAC